MWIHVQRCHRKLNVVGVWYTDDQIIPNGMDWLLCAFHNFNDHLLSGVPDYFDRNKISSGGDLSHYSSASLYFSFLLFCLICVY